MGVIAETVPLILVGGGGHCKSCIDVIEQTGVWRIAGILDRNELIGNRVLGYQIIGTDFDIPRYVDQGCMFLITIGQIKTAEPRIKLFDAVKKAGGKCATIVSPRAYVSPHASVGDGTIVMHQALINAAATVGCNTIINTLALIEHDAVVGDHCHISTSAVINGGAEVGGECFVGSGAVLHQGTRLMPGEIIPAGTIRKGAS